MDDTQRRRITMLAVMYIFRATDASEDMELKEWMDRDPENRKIVEEFFVPGVMERCLEEYEEIDKVAAWDNLTEKIPALLSVSKQQLFPEYYLRHNKK